MALARFPLQKRKRASSHEARGYAMAAGLDPPQGSVLGKALQELDRGTGTIRMLVTLQ